MKKLLTRGRLAWAALFALCWGLTPLAFVWADMERGYDSTGGEALIPLIPVIALVMALGDRKPKEAGKRGTLDHRTGIYGRGGQYIQGAAGRQRP